MANYQKKPEIIEQEKASIQKDVEKNQKAEIILWKKKHEKSP